MLRARLAIAVVCISAFGCLRYYRLELRPEKFAPADVILVPGQELTDDGRAVPLLYHRVLAGVRLWERGLAPRILMSGGKPKSGVTEAEKMRTIAVSFGVPAEHIVLETRSTTSKENAIYSAQLMLERRWRSALVVTHDYHIMYAMPVFADAFRERHLDLYWTPVEPGALRNDRRWWPDERGAR